MKNVTANSDKLNAIVEHKHSEAQFKYPLEVKLQRFEVNEEKQSRFNEWMNFLRDRRKAAVETLEDEKAYFEAVFSDESNGKKYAYWRTFKGAGGKQVESSKHELDKMHLEFWNECIKPNSRLVFTKEFYLTPDFLDQAISLHQAKDKN
jgi:hypothetical protein